MLSRSPLNALCGRALDRHRETHEGMLVDSTCTLPRPFALCRNSLVDSRRSLPPTSVGIWFCARLAILFASSILSAFSRGQYERHLCYEPPYCSVTLVCCCQRKPPNYVSLPSELIPMTAIFGRPERPPFLRTTQIHAARFCPERAAIPDVNDPAPQSRTSRPRRTLPHAAVDPDTDR